MRRLFLLVEFVFVISLSFSQKTISGYVYDADTKEAIIGANIIDSLHNNGTTTNAQAYYVLQTKSPEIKVTFIGYQPQVLQLNCKTDTIVNVYLKPLSYQLGEVVVHAESKTMLSQSRLNINEIVQLPALGGQTDVIKSVEILPGIKAQTEATSLLIVRGGDPGQNLFLLDNSPLLYVNHLGGFMSVFNPEIISDIKVLKSGFPAKYGGKLSSIIDITQRYGNSDKLKGSFGIGFTDVNLCLEDKLSDKFTYIFAVRKTLYDLFLLSASAFTDGNDSNFTYGFYDINLKGVWKVTGRNTLTVNIFQGDDFVATWNKNKRSENGKVNASNIWGNSMIGLSWNSIISPNVFAKTNFSFTRYRIIDKQKFSHYNGTQFNNKTKSTNSDLTLNTLWTFSLFKYWQLTAGLHFNSINCTPFSTYKEGQYQTEFSLSERIHNYSASLSNTLKFGRIAELELGARLTHYLLSDTSELFIEPRADLTFNMHKAGHLNLNYMQISQPTHLIITNGNIYSNEIWIPSNKIIPVAQSWQAAIEWSKDFYKNMFSLAVGAYYKDFSNLVGLEKNVYYKSELENWQQIIQTNGAGTTYGAEFMFKKNYGRLTGTVSYHYSKATRQFDNINRGRQYLYEYNRPHDLSIFLNYKLNDKLSLSIVWNYQTGLPYTPAIGRQQTLDPYSGECYEALIFGERNSAKMRDYHRLDIGLRYEKLTKHRKLRQVWSFSIYNLYNRHNPSYYYYNNNNTGEIHNPQHGFADLDLYQMSIFPFFPSVSYKIYFTKGEGLPENETKKERSERRKERRDKWLNFE